MSVNILTPRQEISRSFEATARLLNELDVTKSDSGSIDALHNNIDGLIGSLSNATFDIHSDLQNVMESFSKGHITARALEEMVRTEHARSLMLKKMTASMKVQLEDVFNLIEKVGDTGEACLKSMQKQNPVNPTKAQLSLKELAGHINNIYSDFSDVMYTVDSMEGLVKAPAIKVSETIVKLHPHIETKLSTPLAQARRLSVASKYDFACREPRGADDVADTEANAEAEERSMQIKGLTYYETRLQSGAQNNEILTTLQSAGAPALDARPEAPPSTPGRPIRVKLFSDRGAQTDVVEHREASVEAVRGSTPVALVAALNSPSDPLDTLLIKGSRASGSAKEIDKARKVLQERQLELGMRESKLIEQQIILDSRANELRNVAQKVVQHEAEAQRRMRELNDIVNERVASEVAKIHELLPPEALLLLKGKVKNFVSRLEIDGDAEDTRNFLETGLRDAQAGHTMADMIADQRMSSMLNPIDVQSHRSMNSVLVEGNSFDALKGKVASDSLGAAPFTPDMRVEHVKTVSYNPASANNRIPTGIHYVGRDDANAGLQMGMHGSASPINVPPPQQPKGILPEMIVIFPPKMSTKSTTTDDLILGSGLPSGLSSGHLHPSKVLITSRHPIAPEPSNKKEPMSDMLIGDSLTRPEVSNSAIDDDSNPNFRRDLPTIHANFGLITRTYRHIAPRDLKKEISDSENPLLTMFEEFKESLPDVFRGPLLDAASGASQMKAKHIFDKLFTSMLPDIRKLDGSSSIVLKELALCEEMTNSMIVVLGTGEITDPVYFRSLKQMFSKFGEIEALKLWNDIQLGQYRVIFERVNAMNITMIPGMLKFSAAFDEAYQVFTSSSGRTVEAHARFTALKNRCKRYKIGEMEHIADRSSSSVISVTQYSKMQEELESLRQELTEAEEEIEELNLEVFKQMQEGDRTPGALLFYAALHDPVTTNVLQQIILQLKALKPFADGSDHVDFTTLRKRLQVSISCIPSVERFVSRYAALHKKWCANRLGLFTSKALVGGGSDAVNLCPMCSNDPSKFLPPGGLLNRRGAAKRNKEEINAVKRQQQALLNSHKQKSGRGGLLGEMTDSVTMESASMGSQGGSMLPSVTK